MNRVFYIRAWLFFFAAFGLSGGLGYAGGVDVVVSAARGGGIRLEVDGGGVQPPEFFPGGEQKFDVNGGGKVSVVDSGQVRKIKVEAGGASRVRVGGVLVAFGDGGGCVEISASGRDGSVALSWAGAQVSSVGGDCSVLKAGMPVKAGGTLIVVSGKGSSVVPFLGGKTFLDVLPSVGFGSEGIVLRRNGGSSSPKAADIPMNGDILVIP